MTMLTREKCVACRRDSPRVTDEEVAELHPQVSDWELTDMDGIPRLQRTFRFRDFGGALNFATELGRSADAEGHHPRITVEWGRVGVDWWTHKIRGLHRNDFIMAAKTDAMYADAAANETSNSIACACRAMRGLGSPSISAQFKGRACQGLAANS